FLEPLGVARDLPPFPTHALPISMFMARQLGEEVGDTVGYRIRFESRVSARTRIEVVTEGILTRMIQDDPALSGVGALLFDEFHEDRKSTRLNSSHVKISYAVFCL